MHRQLKVQVLHLTKNDTSPSATIFSYIPWGNSLTWHVRREFHLPLKMASITLTISSIQNTLNQNSSPWGLWIVNFQKTQCLSFPWNTFFFTSIVLGWHTEVSAVDNFIPLQIKKVSGSVPLGKCFFVWFGWSDPLRLG